MTIAIRAKTRELERGSHPEIRIFLRVTICRSQGERRVASMAEKAKILDALGGRMGDGGEDEGG